MPAALIFDTFCGFQACFVMTVITIWVRMDVYATVYAILLIIVMCIKTRKVMYRLVLLKNVFI